MNIDIWRNREPRSDEILSGKIDEDQLHSLSNEELDEWDNLKKQVSVCNKCVLHQSRNQTVFGSGLDDPIPGQAVDISYDKWSSKM